MWQTKFTTAPTDAQLLYLYVANDVIQNGKRDHPEVLLAFGKPLPKVVAQLCKDGNKRMQGRVERIVDIWFERRMYDKRFCDHLRSMAGIEVKTSSAEPKAATSSAKSSSGPAMSDTDKKLLGLPIVAAMRDVTAAETERASSAAKVETIDYDTVISSGSAPAINTARAMLEAYERQLLTVLEGHQVVVAQAQQVLDSHASAAADLAIQVDGVRDLIARLSGTQ